MRRVQRQRSQHRAGLGAVIILDPGKVGGIEVLEAEETDAVFGQRQAGPPAVMLAVETMHGGPAA